MKDTIRIAGVVKESIVDGPGLRFAVFTQGCAHHCPECQNPETWDFEGGYDCGIDKILKAMDENPLLDGITMSGGDPLYQAEASYSLCSKVKEKGLNVVVFTGYTYEELMELEKKDPWIEKLLGVTDILIDGRYEKDKRDLTLIFRGSSNQRVIDMNASRKEGRAVLHERYN
jgi:anaerobic ribonucleoside-triphosphate reductase activating protein